ncbi:MAG: hypothetical protein PHI63_02185 [Patescibacteria group bacterium]|nr:hypothetical protein [Patescibacteria group bacterium]
MGKIFLVGASTPADLALPKGQETTALSTTGRLGRTIATRTKARLVLTICTFGKLALESLHHFIRGHGTRTTYVRLEDEELTTVLSGLLGCEPECKMEPDGLCGGEAKKAIACVSTEPDSAVVVFASPAMLQPMVELVYTRCSDKNGTTPKAFGRCRACSVDLRMENGSQPPKVTLSGFQIFSPDEK